MKGVMSFLVASVFLLVLVSSAAKLPGRAPDVSYQPIVSIHLQEAAIGSAFSDALSEAAGKAFAASQSLGAGAPSAVRAAVYLSALDFEAQLRASGHDIVFWCGTPGEGALQDASSSMADGKGAIVPDGALPLSNPACAGSFDVNLLRKKVRAAGIGFSLYTGAAGIGHAYLQPGGFEGDFGE